MPQFTRYEIKPCTIKLNTIALCFYCKRMQITEYKYRKWSLHKAIRWMIFRPSYIEIQNRKLSYNTEIRNMFGPEWYSRWNVLIYFLVISFQRRKIIEQRNSSLRNSMHNSINLTVVCIIFSIEAFSIIVFSVLKLKWHSLKYEYMYMHINTHNWFQT